MNLSFLLDLTIVNLLYTAARMAIATIAHKGLSFYFFRGSSAKLRADLVPRLQQRLSFLDQMEDMGELEAIPAWRLHRLQGKANDRWSIWVNKNWRLTFEWDGKNVQILDLEDYH